MGHLDAVTSWCRPCKDRGRLAVARHEVAGTPMCDACFEGKPSNGVSTKLAAEFLAEKKKEGNVIGARPKIGKPGPNEETRAAILKDAADGMSVEAIRKKHSTGWITVKNIITGKNGSRGAARPRKYSIRNPRSLSVGVTLAVTPELVEAIWATLPLEKKAALLNRLADLN